MTPEKKPTPLSEDALIALVKEYDALRYEKEEREKESMKKGHYVESRLFEVQTLLDQEKLYHTDSQCYLFKKWAILEHVMASLAQEIAMGHPKRSQGYIKEAQENYAKEKTRLQALWLKEFGRKKL